MKTLKRNTLASKTRGSIPYIDLILKIILYDDFLRTLPVLKTTEGSGDCQSLGPGFSCSCGQPKPLHTRGNITVRDLGSMSKIP